VINIGHFGFRSLVPKYSTANNKAMTAEAITAVVLISWREKPSSKWAIYPRDNAVTIAPAAEEPSKIVIRSTLGSAILQICAYGETDQAGIDRHIQKSPLPGSCSACGLAGEMAYRSYPMICA
jgi:hypothetical protein